MIGFGPWISLLLNGPPTQVSALRQLLSQVGARMEEDELEDLFQGLEDGQDSLTLAQFIALVTTQPDQLLLC
jgi:hypothetical protein